MELKFLTYFPDKPQEFFDFAHTTLGLSEEEIFKLSFLSLKINALSDLPIYKFLERTIPFIKFDEIGKREYLLTLSIYTLREILLEHFDLKFSKNLYIYLKEKLPKNVFKGCAPKRGVVISQDLSFELLSKEEMTKFPPYLKVKHFIFHYKVNGTCEGVLSFISTINFYVMKRLKDNLYEIYFPLNISEFLYYSNLWVKREYFLPMEIDTILNQLKSLLPDCFERI
ncbi:MAG: hypothetical protein ACK4GE_03155 [Caldimicrobium sp.]